MLIYIRCGSILFVFSQLKFAVMILLQTMPVNYYSKLNGWSIALKMK